MARSPIGVQTRGVTLLTARIPWSSESTIYNWAFCEAQVVVFDAICDSHLCCVPKFMRPSDNFRHLVVMNTVAQEAQTWRRSQVPTWTPCQELDDPYSTCRCEGCAWGCSYELSDVALVFRSARLLLGRSSFSRLVGILHYE